MEYPKQILAEVSWSFGLGQFDSKALFLNELKEYNDDVGNDDLDMDQIVLTSARVIILFEVEDEGEENTGHRTASIEAENGANFTLGELMYRLNKDIGEKIEDTDSRFFEGLLFLTDEDPDFNYAPAYYLNTGS